MFCVVVLAGGEVGGIHLIARCFSFFYNFYDNEVSLGRDGVLGAVILESCFCLRMYLRWSLYILYLLTRQVELP